MSQKAFKIHCTHCERLVGVMRSVDFPPRAGLTLCCDACQNKRPAGEEMPAGTVEDHRVWREKDCAECGGDFAYPFYQYTFGRASPAFCRECFLKWIGVPAAQAAQMAAEYAQELRDRSLRIYLSGDLDGEQRLLNTGFCPAVALRSDSLTYRFEADLETRSEYEVRDGKWYWRTTYWKESSGVQFELSPSVFSDRGSGVAFLFMTDRDTGKQVQASAIHLDRELLEELMPPDDNDSPLREAGRALVDAWKENASLSDAVTALEAALKGD